MNKTTEIHCHQYINELAENTTEYIFDNFTSIESVYDIKKLVKNILGDEYTLTVCLLQVDENELITACDNEDACELKADLIMENMKAIINYQWVNHYIIIIFF